MVILKNRKRKLAQVDVTRLEHEGVHFLSDFFICQGVAIL
jgi:hypothetical protein